MNKILYMIIPCYNEQEVLPETSKRLKEQLTVMIDEKLISEKSRVIFVNDGSSDSTWEIICGLNKEDKLFGGINLSRNRGHQNALLAGLMTVYKQADIMISMDADLQDDVHAIREMVVQNDNGFDIVYGVRSKRAKDSFFKRGTAQGFYKMMRAMGVECVYNHADFRLMSRRTVEALAEFDEVNLFLRGMVPLLGFPSTTVYYERAERFAGESKYPLRKMISFAIEGITSLSIQPIRLITKLGLLVFLVSIAILIYSLVRHYTGHTVTGWTTTVLSIWAIGGLVLLSQGVIGEYIGKIYLETKRRPRFIVQDYINTPDEDDTNGQ